MIEMDELINIYKSVDLNKFLKKYTGLTLEENNLTLSKIQSQWKFLGNNSSNASAVGILTNGEKGLIERITNAIDAVIEKQKAKFNIGVAKNSDVIIKKAFPKFYENKVGVAKGTIDSCRPYEADDQVILAINDSGSSRKPTFDIIDKGTGISGDLFPETILSIQHGNKLSSDKGYLIGAFGQGGSTSLPFTAATIIISKYNDKFYFTVIKSVELQDYKNHCYVYMTIDGKISEISYNGLETSNYYNSFLNGESGTLIRMIETDISKNLRDNEITKPGMLGDYVNTELFNVGLPVKLIENRADYSNNAHVQNRNSFGTFSKLQTWKSYVKKDYSGSIDVEVNGQTYKIDYYTILPPKEEDWGRDGEARKTFVQFNSSLDPILYTVNGQTITTDRFLRLKNAGLNFMRYRLLVVINLDNLGMEKYKFFTTDRNHIKETDQTRGFLDKVVSAIANVDKLKEMNAIIADKAINSNIDNDLINDISKEVKNLYNSFLKGGAALPRGGHGHHQTPTDEEEYLDVINDIEITTTKIEYYKDQAVNIILTTGAQKHMNQNAMIYAYIDGKANYNATPSFMNGRIQYTWDAKTLKSGVHQVQFRFFKGTDSMDSNTLAIEVLNENMPETKKKENEKALDLKINIVSEQELICDISKNKETGSIIANLCLETDDMVSDVYGFNSAAEKIKETQSKIIKPIVLFALFMGESYDSIESANEKNKLIVSFVRSFLTSSQLVL